MNGISLYLARRIRLCTGRLASVLRRLRARRAAMDSADRFAPRALLVRPSISIAVTQSELYTLIEALESKASHAAEDANQVDFADYAFRRIAELREALR
jgi:hypothetical protein